MIGVYAFTFDNWKEMNYPLDLWLEWNCSLFDEVALYYIGDREKLWDGLQNILCAKLRIDGEDGTKDEAIKKHGDNTYAYYKKKAQEILNTEWKFMLDIDEFIDARPDESILDPKKVYGIWMHVLYGNVNYEINPYGYSPVAIGNVGWGRLVHYDNDATIIGDGHKLRVPINGDILFDVYHTTLLRNGQEIARRTWLWQQGIPFINIQDYKKYWYGMEVIRVSDDRLPKILRDNKMRFQFFRGDFE